MSIKTCKRERVLITYYTQLQELKMKVYAIALLACGSAIAFLVILRCLCSVGCKKKKTRYPPIPRSVTGPSSVAPRTYNTDVETGENAQGSGGKVSVLAGSAGVAAVATAAAVTIISSGGGGGGCGGGGCGSGGCSAGGCGGGGCGGGGCGGGGCGGGCGG